jgi:hypothetical protein
MWWRGVRAPENWASKLMVAVKMVLNSGKALLLLALDVVSVKVWRTVQLV